VAGVLTWFYNGEGGDFEYWPEGEHAPSMRERPPFGNVAVVTDSDRMYHRVGAIGRPDQYLPEGSISASAKLQLKDNGGWQIIDGGKVRVIYEPGQIRVSLLWKAIVFENEAAAAAFEDHSDDITLERATDIFCADLGARAIKFKEPSDPIRDPQWPRTLVAAYPLRSFNQPATR